MMMVPPGRTTRDISASAASGSGTAVITYIATATSKLASAKARRPASITATPATRALRRSRSTRSAVLTSISGEMSMPVTSTEGP